MKVLLPATLVVALICLIIYQNIQISKLKTTISNIKDNQNSGQKDIGDGVTRSSIEVVDSLDKQLKDVPIEVIKDDVKQTGSEVIGINKTDFTSVKKKETDIESTRTEPRVDQAEKPKLITDGFGHLNNTRILSLSETIGNQIIPFGEVGFSAWKKKPWSQDILERRYESTTVIAEDKHRRKTVYTTFNIEVNNTKYQIQIQNAKFTQVLPKSSFSWSPRILIGISPGISFPAKFAWGPTIGVSIGSYGQYQSYPDWYIGILSLGYEAINQRLSFFVSPVSYRISKHIPLTENLFIGPEVGIDTSANVIILGGFKLGL